MRRCLNPVAPGPRCAGLAQARNVALEQIISSYAARKERPPGPGAAGPSAAAAGGQVRGSVSRRAGPPGILLAHAFSSAGTRAPAPHPRPSRPLTRPRRRRALLP